MTSTPPCARLARSRGARLRQCSRSSRGSLIALAPLALLACSAAGQSTAWLAPESGDFDDPLRWSSGVPGTDFTALFGLTSGSQTFDVSLGGPRTVGVLDIATQSPRFLPTPRVGRTSLTALNSFRCLGTSFAPAVVFDRVDLVSPGLTFIGTGPGQPNAVSFRDASLSASLLDVGVTGTGTLLLDGSSELLRLDPTAEWRVGSGSLGAPGVGVLELRGGATCHLGGGTLRVGAVTAATGTLTVGEGTSLFLEGASLRIGERSSSQAGAIAGTATIAGRLVGPGEIRLGAGSNTQGTLVLAEGAVIEAFDLAEIVVGAGSSGIGRLVLDGSHDIPSLSIGSASSGSLDVVGEGAETSIGSLSLGVGNAGFLTAIGSELTVGTLVLAAPFSRVRSEGASVTITSAMVEESSTAKHFYEAAGPNAVLVLPEPIGTYESGSVSATAGATISMETLRSTDFRSKAIEVNGGSTLSVAGPIHLAASYASAQDTITLGPAAPAAPDWLFAESIRIESNSTTRWNLPLEGGAMMASSIELFGRLQVINSDGFAPTAPVDIPLAIAESCYSLQRPKTTPIFFGYPSLTRVHAKGIDLRVIDHIDGFTVPASLRLTAGELVAVPALVQYEGETYDMSTQASWSFSPPNLMKVVQGSTLEALVPGSGTATLTFGLASVSIPVAVEPGGPASLIDVASATVGCSGPVVGTAHSGWDGPAAFPLLRAFGPRSLSSDGQIVAFGSAASNLVGDPASGTNDTFVSALAAETIVELTGPTAGITGTSKGEPAMSGDGRFVVTTVDGTVNGLSGAHAVLFDRLAGTAEIMSLTMSGTAATALSFGKTRVSDDGRLVAFASVTSTLVPDDTNGVTDVFVRDRLLGTTTRVSLPPGGGQFVGACTLADMTPDGRYVAFLRQVAAFRLAFRHDRWTGETIPLTPGLIDDLPAILVQDVQLTDDGLTAYILASVSESIVIDPPAGFPVGQQVYRRDTVNGLTSVASVSEEGAWANASIEGFACSADGRYLAFATKADNLAADMTDLQPGRTWLVRRDTEANRGRLLATGLQGPFDKDISPFLALSDDGSRVGFVTHSSNVIPQDVGVFNDVFVVQVPALPAADLDGDGLVGPSDLAALLGSWGTSGPADLDGNGSVGVEDLAILLGAWSA